MNQFQSFFLANSLETWGVWTFDDGVELDWMPQVEFNENNARGLVLDTRTFSNTGRWHDTDLAASQLFICEKDR